MNRQCLLVALAVACTTLPLAETVRAQDATPPAGTPSAESVSCTAEPRDVAELVTLWFGPSGSPAATPPASESFADIEALPVGEDTDEETITAIDELTREWIYCSEVVEQYARAFSLMTDNLAAQWGPDLSDPTQDSPEEVRPILEAQLTATPVAEQMGRMPPLAGPRRARILDDGRAGAIWSFGGDKVFVIYQRDGDYWLIDDVIDIIEPAGTPVP